MCVRYITTCLISFSYPMHFLLTSIDVDLYLSLCCCRFEKLSLIILYGHTLQFPSSLNIIYNMMGLINRGFVALRLVLGVHHRWVQCYYLFIVRRYIPLRIHETVIVSLTIFSIASEMITSNSNSSYLILKQR
jgi:hypothetical protein